MKTGLFSTAAVLAMASFCMAQTVRWSAPVLGYYYDSESRSIRLIGGVPGAASLDGGLPVGSKLESAALSPSRDYAFATSLEAEHTLVVSFRGAQVTGSQALEQAAPGFDSVWFSPDGRSAALVWKAAGTIQIWNNLPGAPELAREAQIGDFAALAVSNGGAQVAVADSSGVHLLGADTPLLAGTGFTALAFSPVSSDLAAANRDLGQIVLLSADKQTALGAPGAQAIAFSADGSRLLATAGSQVLSFDLGTQAASAITCDCTLSTLERVQGNAVFRVSSAKDGYFSLYDGDGIEPRITLIAAGGIQ